MKKTIILLIIGVFCVCVGGKIAANKVLGKNVYWNLLDKMLVNNNLLTDTVNFDLDIININKNKTIMPGENINEIIRISNKGIPCYIRLRGEFVNWSKNIFNVNNNWVKKGDYYYYKNVLKAGETVDFSNRLKIPESLDNSWKSKNLPLKIYADGVQESNLDINLKEEDPWKGLTIEKSIRSTIHPIALKRQYTNLSLSFDGKTNKFITNSKDLFSNMKNLSPGDKIEDVIHINNSENKKVKICLQVNDLKETKDKEFMKNLKLILSDKDKELYKGPLYTKNNNGEISLGIFSPKDKKDIKFSLEMPNSMDNKYTEEEENVNWRFVAYDFQEPSKPNPKPKDASGEDISVSDEVKTGDNSNQNKEAFIFITSFTCICLMAYKKRRKLSEKI